MFLRNKTVGLIGRAFVLWTLAGWYGSGLQAETFGDLSYTDYGNAITITNYIGSGGPLTIPESINDTPVTAIGTKFLGHSDGVTSVAIPPSVTNIGYLAFAYCDVLEAIHVDTNNLFYSSEGGALFNKSKTSLIQCPPAWPGIYTVPEGVTKLDPGFFDCENLTGVVFSASVSSLHDVAFNLCLKLTSIAVDTNSLSYSSNDGVLFNRAKTTLVRCPPTRVGAYEIPSGVTNLGQRAFFECTGLNNIIFPLSLTDIGTLALYSCNGLSEVVLSPNITRIQNDAFSYSRTLRKITFPSNIQSFGSTAFKNCLALTHAYFLGNSPAMGSSVFTNCAASFKVYYLAGKTGFTSPTWNGYPSAVLGGAAILPSGIPSGTEYEAWVLTNAAAWNAVNFTAVPAEDFERAWLLHTMPKTNLAAKTDFLVKNFTVGSDEIQVTLGLGVAAQPKAGAVNGWLAIDGRESMTNAWQTMAGQSAGQNKLSFTNGQATVLFDKPADMRFFRPRLQKDVPNSGSILPLNQTN